MKISDCMKRDVVAIPKTASVADAIDLLVGRHIGLLPVVDEQRHLAGVLDLHDLLGLALPAFIRLVDDVDFVHDFGAVESAHPEPEALRRPVTSVMRPATTVPETCGLMRAYALMRQRDLHDLPVVDPAGRLAGIASRVDVAAAIMRGWRPPKDGEP